MPAPHHWTDDQDHLIRQGIPWPIVARRIGLCRWTVRERARKLGLLPEVPALSNPARLADEPADDRRASYPPGHPVTWGALIAGTCLDGVEYLP